MCASVLFASACLLRPILVHMCTHIHVALIRSVDFFDIHSFDAQFKKWLSQAAVGRGAHLCVMHMRDESVCVLVHT